MIIGMYGSDLIYTFTTAKQNLYKLYVVVEYDKEKWSNTKPNKCSKAFAKKCLRK